MEAFQGNAMGLDLGVYLVCMFSGGDFAVCLCHPDFLLMCRESRKICTSLLKQTAKMVSGRREIICLFCSFLITRLPALSISCLHKDLKAHGSPSSVCLSFSQTLTLT